MDLTAGWTGRTACALQVAMRMTNDTFAEHLGIGTRTVASWHQKPDLRPKSEMQQLLDTALDQAPSAVKDRFNKLMADTTSAAPPQARATDADPRLDTDPNIAAALDWLDQHAAWQPGTARHQAATRLAQLDVRELRARGTRRGRVDQPRIAQALAEYYRDRTGSRGLYTARYGGDSAATTGILTRPEWLDLACPLTAATDRLTVTTAAKEVGGLLDDQATDSAAQRLAETLALGVRLVNMPLYRLLDIDVRNGQLAGSLGIAPFVGYALTLDLLESELVDALAADVPARPGSLPLRDRYLPDIDSVLNVSERLCAGGTLALLAIARPAAPHRGEADYLLLIQERSGHVINAARRLAVIPKGFHQPMADYRADARISATLWREMEEELFGRDDIDNTVTEQRRADPMHPTRLSEPGRWLMDDPGRVRMECTGFGLNLVSGNYEFPSLIVIEDEEFWSRYGGEVEANWESSTLRQYSSLDRHLLTELIDDVAWSNEGLFAFLQGLRRLAEIGGSRVDSPTIEWEMR